MAIRPRESVGLVVLLGILVYRQVLMGTSVVQEEQDGTIFSFLPQGGFFEPGVTSSSHVGTYFIDTTTSNGTLLVEGGAAGGNSSRSKSYIDASTSGTSQTSLTANNSSSTASASSYTEAKEPNTFLTFDILSIGSKTRLDYLQGQRDTFAKHKSVRHFFTVTEDIDDDKLCTVNMTDDNAMRIVKFCHKKFWNKQTQYEMRFMRNHYASKAWLLGKANPGGWLCAQTRPIVALYKVALRKYKDTMELPDYLIIVDDDTHLNLPMIHEYFQSDPTYFTSTAARTIAGCLVRKPVLQLHFTMTIGGYGLFFSKATIQNMMRPIHCESNSITTEIPRSTATAAVTDVATNISSDTTIRKENAHENAFNEPALCKRVNANFIGERPLFKEGMSVGDLMYAYATDQPYSQIANWTTGYCMHSDWMWGFFVNFYNLSDHDEEPYFKDIPQARMVGFNGSEVYDGKNTDLHVNRRRVCNNSGKKCVASSSPICHYIPPDQMRNMTVELRRTYPTQFRN